MTKETYYAVRIGDPRYHLPYFMTLDGKAPALFLSRKDAEAANPKQSSTKVVRVTIHDGRCAANAPAEARRSRSLQPDVGTLN